MLSPGQRSSHFEVLSKLGSGGMGIVYKARDIQLDRLVALKVLQPARADDAGLRSRLLREARAASSLNHPNIVTVHEAGTADGVDFIAMEYVEGVTLAQRIPPNGMPVDEALSVARAVAAALSAAHAAGVVHRDLKPANVMVRSDGVVKVMDFGLAKALAPPPGEEAETRTALDGGQTAAGVILGTGAYMSPEQAEGKPVDARSDIFSFGAMFYQMLTGRRAFHGDTLISTISSVLKDTPAPLHHLRREIAPPLEAIVDRCLEKNREGRYASGADLAAALDRAATQPMRPPVRRSRLALRVAVLAALLVAIAWWGVRQWRIRWVHNEAIPQINRLMADQKYLDAYRVAMRAFQILPDDPELNRVPGALGQCCPAVRVESRPLGARVYWRPYPEPNAPEQFLGATPGPLRLPRGVVRLRLVKDGFEDTEGTFENSGTAPPIFVLDVKGSRPGGMVSVGPERRTIAGQTVDLPTFWLDKYEVTNRQFKAFLDAGGYRKQEYWKQPFAKDGGAISWDEAMKLFVDSTGRPGPATWELGSFPEHQEDYPVGGVSWYEAAAYAEFAGKSLPAVAHWQHAAGTGFFSEILNLSNFSGQGSAPAGKYQGEGRFGAYDMAGNLKEWCWNAVGGKRASLGGAWNEAAYKFTDLNASDPMERLPVDGFRCAKFRDPQPAAVFAPVERLARDPDREIPVSDEVFRAWRSYYAYDRTPLDAKVEAIDDSSEYYRKEKINYAAAYGGERILAWLFLPKNGSPPYQTVIYSPSAEAVYSHDSSQLGPQRYLLFIIRSGRALLHPVYQGTYERVRPAPTGPNGYRELDTQRSKDLGRSIDYLETRPDIDRTKLAYYGISMGCTSGVMMVPVEPRIRVALLAWCGIPTTRYAEGTDRLDFAPRFKVPVLLINGRNDFIYPYTTSQLPLFRLLGTPEKDKKMFLTDTGHIAVFTPEMIREALAWLDRYLGPVK